MINLEQIVLKINNVLNGTDTEIPAGAVSPTNDNFFFRTFSEGLILTDIGDMVSGKNFIPVIVGSMGGQFNPVQGLGEADLQAQVLLYFPVRYKKTFYEMVDYLTEVFVGGYLTFGTQKAVCNISPAQFGELQDMNFDQFSEWIENTYKIKANIQDVYMSMSFTLFLSTAKGIGSTNGFMYGNDAKITKIEIKKTTYGINGTPNTTTILTDTTPIIIERADINDSTPASQQILDSYYAKGMGANTSVVKQLPLMIKNTTGYRSLLDELEVNKSQQALSVTVSETIGFTSPLSISSDYIIINYSRGTSLGKLLSVSLTLTPKV